MPKKNFKQELNPALQFISSPIINDENQAEKANPMKRNPLYLETKSKRVQLLMQPSLHSKLKEMAKQKETSINDLIHTMLDQAASELEQYT